MATLSFEDARQCVFERIRGAIGDIPSQDASLADVQGRVLAEDVRADRDYPPLARSVRDGFAIRSQDLPGEVTVTTTRASRRMAGMRLRCPLAVIQNTPSSVRK